MFQGVMDMKQAEKYFAKTVLKMSALFSWIALVLEIVLNLFGPKK